MTVPAKTEAPTIATPPCSAALTMRNGVAMSAAMSPSPWLTLFAISSPTDSSRLGTTAASLIVLRGAMEASVTLHCTAKTPHGHGMRLTGSREPRAVGAEGDRVNVPRVVAEGLLQRAVFGLPQADRAVLADA